MGRGARTSLLDDIVREGARRMLPLLYQDDLVGLPVLESMLSWRADSEPLSHAAQTVDRHSLLVEIEAVGQTLLSAKRS
jgi:hypothetical protein